MGLSPQGWPVISYCHKDEEFAERLHSRMRDKHLRVWYAPEDLKIGDPVRSSVDTEMRPTATAFELPYPTADQVDFSKVNSIMRPTMPTISMWYTRMAW